MKTITVMDRNPKSGLLSVHLSDILAAVGQAARDSRWIIKSIDATGQRAEVLHAAADTGESLQGNELMAVADQIDQVIDGEFCAYRGDNSSPWLVLRAVDSSSWDVSSNCEHALDAVRNTCLSVYEAGDVML